MEAVCETYLSTLCISNITRERKKAINPRANPRLSCFDRYEGLIVCRLRRRHALPEIFLTTTYRKKKILYFFLGNLHCKLVIRRSHETEPVEAC